MQLRPRALVLAALLALPVAIAGVIVNDRIRANDLQVAVGRVVASQINDQVRERCEGDPRWFLTGPLEGRPKKGEAVDPNPDAIQPRPKLTGQPFELFAYDEQFLGSSSAAPRFPLDLRHALQASSQPAFAPFDTPQGRGAQVAIATGWIQSPCMYFLGRMAPPLDQSSRRWRLFAQWFAAAFIVALFAAAPAILRIRRLSALTRASKAEGFSTVALDPGKDELNVVSFVYNDAAEELRLRKARIDDLDAGLRRFVQSTEQEIAGPLGQLESKLAGEPGVASALLDAHALTARVANLTAAARLKMSGLAGTDSIDLGALLQRVVDRHQAIAKAAGVTMETTIDRAPVTIAGDTTLVERAVSNLVDNAILYNRPGGRVVAGLSVAHDAIPGSFRLWIEDTGRGVTEDEFKTLTAIRRFRGDEGRIRRPGAPGLGLAVAREVADRFHMRLELKRPGRGGFEAELSPRPASLPQAEADQALDSPPA